jgi:hypothetical protein
VCGGQAGPSPPSGGNPIERGFERHAANYTALTVVSFPGGGRRVPNQADRLSSMANACSPTASSTPDPPTLAWQRLPSLTTVASPLPCRHPRGAPVAG